MSMTNFDCWDLALSGRCSNILLESLNRICELYESWLEQIQYLRATQKARVDWNSSYGNVLRVRDYLPCWYITGSHGVPCHGLLQTRYILDHCPHSTWRYLCLCISDNRIVLYLCRYMLYRLIFLRTKLSTYNPGYSICLLNININIIFVFQR